MTKFDKENKMVWYDWILIAPIVLGVVLGYRMGLIKNIPVSYTHLTLPTKA